MTPSPPATLKSRLPAAVLAAALLLCAAPAGAQAGSASLEPRAGGLEELVYQARAGEVNRLTLRYDSYSRIWSVDDTAGVTPGRGCALPDSANPGHAVCTVSGSARGSAIANVGLGDGDDSLAVLGPGLARAVIAGGPGSDALVGGPEDDSFWQGDHADGADRVVGGSGDDAVDYSGRRRPVRATVGGRAGERGENDALAGDVEGIVGGRAGDVLRGNARENVLVGGPGADRLKGGGGYDILVGGPGNDRIQARDGSIDDLTCGRGFDRVTLDGLDFFTGGCERLSRNRAGGATVIHVSSDDGGRLLVDVGCPEDTPTPRCVGRLAMAVDGRRLGHDPVDLGRGTRGLFTFQLPADVAERLKAGGRTTAMSVLASRMGRIHRKVRVSWPLPLRH